MLPYEWSERGKLSTRGATLSVIGADLDEGIVGVLPAAEEACAHLDEQLMPTRPRHRTLGPVRIVVADGQVTDELGSDCGRSE